MPEWVRDEAQPSGWRWTGDDPEPCPSATVDVPPRLDGWCEDRIPGAELSDHDGID